MADCPTCHNHTFRCAAPLPACGKTLIMGIVNMTPDSFSNQGAPLPSADEAVEQALLLIKQGADIIDIGAESSRPDAATIDAEEEKRRLGQTVAKLRKNTDKPISIDTYHVQTAETVLDQGADIINDITALRGGWGRADRHNTAMATLASRTGAHLVLMHMPGPPESLRERHEYHDVAGEVASFLVEQAELALRQGVAKQRIWLDPGFGFNKDFAQNRELLIRLPELAKLGYPLLVGMSRKRMIGDALGLPVHERVEASLALAVIASLTGADIIRVHDVQATARAVAMADAIRLPG